MQALAMQALPLIIEHADKIPAIANAANQAIDGSRQQINNFARNALNPLGF